MPRLPLTAKGAGLVLALFSPVIYAGEWESYKEIKANLIRSEKGSKSLPLPTWINALEFEPRPHYWLDDKKSATPIPPVSQNAPISNSASSGSDSKPR